MEVGLRPTGCAGTAGAILSIGLLPLMRRWHEQQYPRAISDEGITLRHGRSIPWNTITRVLRCPASIGNRLVFWQLTVWHAGGKFTWPSHRLTDAAAVEHAIEQRLPPNVVFEEGALIRLPGFRRP